MRRIAGVVWRPRSTMAAVVAAPTFLTTWTIVLILWLIPAAWLLSTDVGQLGLVDERVRLTERLGGTVDDAGYAALLANPPWSAYFVTGGRYLATPPVTVLVAIALVALSRSDGSELSLAGGLAVAVHASIVLVLQQWFSTPLQFLQESLTSPTNLAAVLGLEDGSTSARVFGGLDVFGLWWIWLLALGAGAATGRPARRYVWRLLAVYVGLAIVMAAALAAAGGS